jgi:hypothetical protein
MHLGLPNLPPLPSVIVGMHIRTFQNKYSNRDVIFLRPVPLYVIQMFFRQPVLIYLSVKFPVVSFEVFTAVTCVNRRFGGTSVHTKSTQLHIPENGILRLSGWSAI